MQTNRLLLWLWVICLVLSGVHVLMSVKGGASFGHLFDVYLCERDRAGIPPRKAQ